MATSDRIRSRSGQRLAPRRGDVGHGSDPAVDPVAPVDAARTTGGAGDGATAAALNVIAGIWLVVSPWVLGYTGDDATWNPVVCGAIVIVLALARVSGLVRGPWPSAVNLLIGAWLFASAFWLADSGQASWNVGILGVVVFLLAIWSMTASGASRGAPARS